MYANNYGELRPDAAASTAFYPDAAASSNVNLDVLGFVGTPVKSNLVPLSRGSYQRSGSTHSGQTPSSIKSNSTPGSDG